MRAWHLVASLLVVLAVPAWVFVVLHPADGLGTVIIVARNSAEAEISIVGLEIPGAVVESTYGGRGVWRIPGTAHSSGNGLELLRAALPAGQHAAEVRWQAEASTESNSFSVSVVRDRECSVLLEFSVGRMTALPCLASGRRRIVLFD